MDMFFTLIGREAELIAWWQMCIRAIVIFVYAVLLYRLLPRRAFLGSSAIDVIVLVLMGSSLSRALTGSAPLVPTLAATAAFAALYVALAAVARRSDRLSLLLKGRPLEVIRDGKIDRRAMNRALLGLRDLEEELRLKGIERPEEVEVARIERNGSLSVRRRSGGTDD
ncbi:DUF421 domain-containing protein [Pseudooceanicola sp.]|jgi:uncharacterized membrane protein YcaP (DUF421 family)|uniref:DUF421 domain-containing protein n=1 Tax=Pseudooceanicola sp. TaxID=1914328 RepID=UPI00405A41B6